MASSQYAIETDRQISSSSSSLSLLHHFKSKSWSESGDLSKLNRMTSDSIPSSQILSHSNEEDHDHKDSHPKKLVQVQKRNRNSDGGGALFSSVHANNTVLPNRTPAGHTSIHSDESPSAATFTVPPSSIVSTSTAVHPTASMTFDLAESPSSSSFLHIEDGTPAAAAIEALAHVKVTKMKKLARFLHAQTVARVIKKGVLLRTSSGNKRGKPPRVPFPLRTSLGPLEVDGDDDDEEEDNDHGDVHDRDDEEEEEDKDEHDNNVQVEGIVDADFVHGDNAENKKFMSSYLPSDPKGDDWDIASWDGASRSSLQEGINLQTATREDVTTLMMRETTSSRPSPLSLLHSNHSTTAEHFSSPTTVPFRQSSSQLTPVPVSPSPSLLLPPPPPTTPASPSSPRVSPFWNKLKVETQNSFRKLRSMDLQQPQQQQQSLDHLSVDDEKEDRKVKRIKQKSPRSIKKEKRNVRKSYVKGKVIDREHELYALSIAMMLGLRTSIGNTNSRMKEQLNTNMIDDLDHCLFGIKTSNPCDSEKKDEKDPNATSRVSNKWRWLNHHDFMTVEKYVFRPSGGPQTPPHQLSHTFKVKGYSPLAFANIRRMFGINESEFLLSVCGNANYIEFVSNAKSGQFFFYSSDGKFMIKTMTNAESKFLRRILPHYFQHCALNPNTLIPHFLGMYRVKLYHLRRNVKFIIMNSVFDTDKILQSFFDLKGSSLGRDAKPGQAVKKDNDVRRGLPDTLFSLQPQARERMRKQLIKDLEFMKRMKIMDYSMLIGVHHIPARDVTIPGDTRQTHKITGLNFRQSVSRALQRAQTGKPVVDFSNTETLTSEPSKKTESVSKRSVLKSFSSVRKKTLDYSRSIKNSLHKKAVPRHGGDVEIELISNSRQTDELPSIHLPSSTSDGTRTNKNGSIESQGEKVDCCFSMDNIPTVLDEIPLDHDPYSDGLDNRHMEESLIRQVLGHQSYISYNTVDAYYNKYDDEDSLLDNETSDSLKPDDERPVVPESRSNEEFWSNQMELVSKLKDEITEDLFWPFHRFYSFQGRRRMSSNIQHPSTLLALPEESHTPEATRNEDKSSQRRDDMKEVLTKCLSLNDDFEVGLRYSPNDLKVPVFELPLSNRKDGGFVMDTTGFTLPLKLQLGKTVDCYDGKIFYMGIIDVLQQFNVRKRLEAIIRKLSGGGWEGASCVHPILYADRFLRFFDEYTATCGSKQECDDSVEEIVFDQNN